MDFPMPWDDLSLNQRKSMAAQRDYQCDPATEYDRKFWWDFFGRKDSIEMEIETWEAANTQTAIDPEKRKVRLSELRQQLALMEKKQRNARNDYFDPRNRMPDASLTSCRADYIPYPKAHKLLSDKLHAQPEEIAIWVWMGPNVGGLAAYRNANKLDPPPRFYFDYHMDEDYLAPLMACWFLADDISKFQPIDHYITGKALIERWSKQPSIQPIAFIRAKIAESRLLDMHPTMGGTQWTEESNFPPKESALFAMSHVEAIEVEDFDKVFTNPDATETQEIRRKRLKLRIQQEKVKGTRAFNKVVADEEGISLSRLKQILLDKSVPNNSWPPLASSSRQTSSKKPSSKY